MTTRVAYLHCPARSFPAHALPPRHEQWIAIPSEVCRVCLEAWVDRTEEAADWVDAVNVPGFIRRWLSERVQYVERPRGGWRLAATDAQCLSSSTVFIPPSPHCNAHHDYAASAEVSDLTGPVLAPCGAGPITEIRRPGMMVSRGTVPAVGSRPAFHWSGQAPTIAESRKLALCEAVERASACGNGGTGSVDTHVPRVPAADFGVEDARWNRSYEDCRDWTRATRLGDETAWVVPTDMVFFWSDAQARFCFDSSSGAAVGRTWEDAVMSGLVEVIERDAVLSLWHGSMSVPEIDVDSINDRAYLAMLRHLRRQGLVIRAFYCPLSAGVPSVIAVCTDVQRTFLCVGAAAAPDPHVAVRKALREVMADYPQSRLLATARLSDAAAVRADGSGATHRLSVATRELIDAAAFLLLPRKELLRVSDIPGCPRLSLSELVTCLKTHGFYGYVVDFTQDYHRMVGLSAVKIIVPGLLPLEYIGQLTRALHMPRLKQQMTCFRALGLAPPSMPPRLNLVPHPLP
ncbi:YcaO-like family protein [Corynebacterium silvaticum]|uniref:YcaO-like family protein n=1 Tax=Corynebacterium silvaticum TaxID=2320431 RepID=A0A7Y4PA58_9CORY|nr:YcaO-like family protein [Corynebacterium silvaticum]ARU46615.1 YcaO-like family protein [Corynebacterium silvaticum]MBH5299777.1 YcaO-like family protein [Corynebacterium silvaticum]NOM63905.1 YcaO-like family protein [Corynebacterium silvaticum]NON71046.1 YcaO-like family protein [Corynebacterium silvaticum]TFA91942.1 hypothetical protein EU802_08310 [Corynebacterium silvaticum]